MKTHILMVSKVFPSTHKRKGEPTYFKDKIEMALGKFKSGSVIEHDTKTIIEFWPKLHTIRSNKNGTSYERWSKKIKEVQEVKAILSIRYWSGKPYNSKQVEICKLDKDSGVGVQKLELDPFGVNYKIDDGDWVFDNGKVIAQNDGLSEEDFREWFRKCDLSKPMAIIHFTPFRY